MQLQPFATDAHVEEALRLFQVSTLEAAKSGSLSGAEGLTPDEDMEEVRRIEQQLKRRFAIGSQVFCLILSNQFQNNLLAKESLELPRNVSMT